VFLVLSRASSEAFYCYLSVFNVSVYSVIVYCIICKAKETPIHRSEEVKEVTGIWGLVRLAGAMRDVPFAPPQPPSYQSGYEEA